MPWNGFRTFGPVRTARFDPHPLPRGEHPGNGVIYTALDVPTAVAEVFQQDRIVPATSAVNLTSWTPTHDLQLLDLTGDWALRNGASYALFAAPRSICRTWSREIRTTWPDIDGLWVPSTMTGQTMIALYQPAGDAFPAVPAFSRPLNNPYVWELVSDAATKVGYNTR